MNNIKDVAIAQMLSILKEAGVKSQTKTLYDLLLIYESFQLSDENRATLRPRLEETIKLVQRFKEGDKSVVNELKNRNIIGGQ